MKGGREGERRGGKEYIKRWMREGDRNADKHW